MILEKLKESWYSISCVVCWCNCKVFQDNKVFVKWVCLLLNSADISGEKRLAEEMYIVYICN